MSRDNEHNRAGMRWPFIICVALAINILLRIHLAMNFSAYPILSKAPGSDEAGHVNLAIHFSKWLQFGNVVRLPLYPLSVSAFLEARGEFNELGLYATQNIL